jgi:L-fuconolactonase
VSPSHHGIVDAHIHLWDPALLDYPWLAGSALRRRIDVGVLERVRGSAAQFVVVQADCAPGQGDREVAWLSAQARRYPRLRGIVAFAPLGDGAAAYLADLRRMASVVGVRRLLQDEPAGFAVRPGFLDDLRVLGEFDLPFDICARAEQLGEVVDMVTRVPDTQFVLDHLGKPRVGADDSAWRRDIERLAEQPHVACKLSGLATELVAGAADLALTLPYLRYVLDLFGPARCMFGSDWPVMTAATTYPVWLDIVEKALSDYCPDDRGQVFGATARSVYAISDDIHG